jgi:RNA polymerase sigma-B factor
MAPALKLPAIRVRRGEELELFRRYRRDRDPAIRNVLIERYMPLARHLARRYRSGGEREDVTQVAALGLLKAVDRFDPDNGAGFTSFATPTILGEIKRYFRDYGWAVRMPRELQELAVRLEKAVAELTGALGRAPTPRELADRLDVSVEQVLEALSTDTAHHPVPLDRPARDGEDEPARPLAAVEERGFASVEDTVAVDSLLGRLPERERLIVKLRFHDDLLQREIAELVGISQMQVSRTLTRSLELLQRYAAEDQTPPAASGSKHRPPVVAARRSRSIAA